MTAAFAGYGNTHHAGTSVVFLNNLAQVNIASCIDRPFPAANLFEDSHEALLVFFFFLFRFTTPHF